MIRERSFVVAVLALHWISCILFLALRAPDPPGGALDQLEATRNTGELVFSSAAPWGYVAERPLYSWSEWHGGESVGVKALVIANLVPTLLTTAILDSPDQASTTPIRLQTWIAALVYLALSTMQWWGIGVILEKRCRARAR